MRENPTPASGPVVIKHVRNTVPKSLTAETNPSEALTTTSTGGYAYLTPTALAQLETPTL